MYINNLRIQQIPYEFDVLTRNGDFRRLSPEFHLKLFLFFEISFSAHALSAKSSMVIETDKGQHSLKKSQATPPGGFWCFGTAKKPRKITHGIF
jgi:hypothetical protein|tara:strand:- start:19595 stop:19876 length:282 start_codon:yes stop_codon:yes gene_type:complete